MNPLILTYVVAAIILLGLGGASLAGVPLSATGAGHTVSLVAINGPNNATASGYTIYETLRGFTAGYAVLSSVTLDVRGTSGAWIQNQSIPFFPTGVTHPTAWYARGSVTLPAGTYVVGGFVIAKNSGSASTIYKAYAGNVGTFSLPSVTNSSSGCATCPGVQASFSYTVKSLAATFTDTSNGTNGGSVTGVQFLFGDGTGATTTAGGVVFHNYTAAGNYSVTDTVVGGAAGATNGIASSVTQNITVTKTGGGNGCTASCSTLVNTFANNLAPWNIAAVAAGVSVLVALLIPKLRVIAPPIAGAVVGIVVFFVITFQQTGAL